LEKVSRVEIELRFNNRFKAKIAKSPLFNRDTSKIVKFVTVYKIVYLDKDKKDIVEK